MKINGPGTIRPAEIHRRKPRKDAGSQSFSVDRPDEEASGAPVAKAPALSSVGALLALQEVDGHFNDRQQATRRGHFLLDRLEDIRHALLVGALPRDQLRILAETAREQRPAVEDPRLGQILDEIELRAAVELAKLDYQV
jgi:hypothetical protein